jgi:hypothetical protein
MYRHVGSRFLMTLSAGAAGLTAGGRLTGSLHILLELTTAALLASTSLLVALLAATLVFRLSPRLGAPRPAPVLHPRQGPNRQTRSTR